jgi:hypothetical protein
METKPTTSCSHRKVLLDSVVLPAREVLSARIESEGVFGFGQVLSARNSPNGTGVVSAQDSNNGIGGGIGGLCRRKIATEEKGRKAKRGAVSVPSPSALVPQPVLSARNSPIETGGLCRREIARRNGSKDSVEQNSVRRPAALVPAIQLCRREIRQGNRGCVDARSHRRTTSQGQWWIGIVSLDPSVGPSVSCVGARLANATARLCRRETGKCNREVVSAQTAAKEKGRNERSWLPYLSLGPQPSSRGQPVVSGCVGAKNNEPRMSQISRIREFCWRERSLRVKDTEDVCNRQEWQAE